jgi:magnesium-transporting ATPase (P-type)
MIETTSEFLKKASTNGLRTLCMAVRILDQNELDKFNKDIKEAEKELEDRDQKLEDVYDKLE